MAFALRFDFRNPSTAGTSTAEQYAAAVEMAEWADNLGCVNIMLSEHHGSQDGYLPSPIPVIAAMAARTRNVRFTIAALIAPFYDPMRLAEDLVVLDNLSRGRFEVVIAAGYLSNEFEMFDVAMSARAQRVTEAVETVRGAFSGQPFEFRGRTVHVTPGPYRIGGLRITLGGSSPAAARRAARIADAFLPSTPDVWDDYCAELGVLGKPDPGPCPLGASPALVTFAEDVEDGWAQMAPHYLHQVNSYGAWQSQSGIAMPYRTTEDAEALRATGQYRVVTPAVYIAEQQLAPDRMLTLHPMIGGAPPALAWQSLRLFERDVLPALN